MSARRGRVLLLAALLGAAPVGATQTVTRAYTGITHIDRTQTAPRPLRIHVIDIDLAAPGMSEGMTTAELAAMLVRDYGAVDAINLDGGGSTTLAMDQPAPHIVNTPSDRPPRAVGSNLAVFALPLPSP